MKFSLFNSASIASAFLFTTVVNAAPSTLRGLQQNQDDTGIFLIQDIQYDPDTRRERRQRGRNLAQEPDETLNIALADGIYTLQNVPNGWLKESGAESGVTQVKIPPGVVKNSQDKIIDMKGKRPQGVGSLFDRSLKDIANRTPEQERNLEALRASQESRKLYTGTKTFLAIRVKGADATTTSSEAKISDSWFGNGNDSVNIKSQYEACSYGDVTVQKSTGNGVSGASAKIGDDGVYEVTISNTISGTGDGTIREAVTAKLRTDFGVSSESQLADHVMLCLPGGTSGGWIGYAYYNWHLSVFNNAWCDYLSIQMHEIGHNINLAHAGEAETYDDQSGMMGFSYSTDDGPLMCFNAPKNHQLGWYSDKEQVVTDCYEGNIYGIADYDKIGADDKVMLQIPGANGMEYYVSFNRQTGINSGTREGGNRVLVHSQQSGRNESDLLAKLAAGGTSTAAPLSIEVVTINTSASPGYATVKIGGGCGTNPPTTANPTSPPNTANPTSPPTTANPTSPPSTSPPTTANPTSFPTTANPTTVPTSFPTNVPTVFQCSNFNQAQCGTQPLCEWQNKGPNKYCKDAENAPSPPSPSPPSPTPDQCTPGSGGRNARCSSNSDCRSCNCKNNGKCG